ncbi:protein LURP-one-related 5-like [Phalaenopsis equestris]|uniref:protein LURP-one-related 5-like n=1 Tax=Phalaenopsis equestris TaxID=78828 RepID=UPI0009E3598F|nr:protein LURP-one-related 5-like [Phalaenopsis equestris]
MAAKPTISTAESWTVWKKSSMAFVGTVGFSIFDSQRKLAFRVDNYSRGNKYSLGELLLTDAVGRPLLAPKPQILSIHDQWNGYRSEDHVDSITSSFKTLIFTMKRRSILKNSHDDVEIFMHGSKSVEEEAEYQIEGCFRKRSCRIWGRSGKLVAWMCRKMVSPLVILEEDIFRVFVVSGTECDLIMAFIVVMDRICKKLPFNFKTMCR